MTVTRSLIACAVLGLAAALSAQTDRSLRIYAIDVEGGGATLFVAPSGESLLVDAGNGDAAAIRDATRIMAAVDDAGLRQIDYLVVTHYHGDHVGGVGELASRIPIRHFIDHGPTVEPNGSGSRYLPPYQALYAKARHTVVKPGDTIPLSGVDVRVATSAGRAIATPFPGAGAANPACASVQPIAPDASENAQSVGLSLAFGRFRVAHLGDLTWNGELDLMCPVNKFGTADLFIVSHHAQQRENAMSNSAALVHGLRPRVAISSNGLRKGAQVPAMQVLFTSPGLEDLWQLHFSVFSGQEYTVPGAFIANWSDEPADAAMPIAPLAGQPSTQGPIHNGPAFYFKIVAADDGSFTVTNTRNGFSKTYAAGRAERQAAAAASRSTRDGVYTAAQASRGQEKFQQICTACHKVSDHAGPTFATRWTDTTLGDLFELVSNTMPEGNPGSLEKADYAAILAFFLKESGYPAGPRDLPADVDALKTIRIEPAQ